MEEQSRIVCKAWSFPEIKSSVELEWDEAAGTPALGVFCTVCGRVLLAELCVKPCGLAGLDVSKSKMRICSQELADNPEGHIDELRAGLASVLEAKSIARKA